MSTATASIDEQNKLTEDLKEYIYYNDLFENVKIADSRATS